MDKTLKLDSNVCQNLMSRYERAIIHMRQQNGHSRFGLIFGAGISKDFGFPSWKELIERIAQDRRVTITEEVEKAILNRSNNYTSRAQQLFQSYHSAQYKEASPDDHKHHLLDMKIRAGWRKIVRDCLYKDVPKGIEELLTRDRYLHPFIKIIKDSPLTITYNFDDTLEKMLANARTPEERIRGRGYTTVWSGNVQLQSKKAVIYHPNGYLPSDLPRNRPSENFVFLEDSFADQLIDSMSGHYTSLVTHLSQTTCLFVGSSLDDPTLKHLLRQNAKAHPGHYHYFVQFVQDEINENLEQQKAQSAANFDVYNLITLFLGHDEIKALGQLLTLDDNEFITEAQVWTDHLAFKFYVTGPVGVGKSTVVSHFRSLLTQDEWTEPRAEGMEKAPELLTKQDRENIDQWVADQISKKNVALANCGTGMHLMDRAPLDAFAFTPQDEWIGKATLIRSKVSPGIKSAKERRLCRGHVILMVGDPCVMASRAVSLHKDTTSDKLSSQQDLLLAIYGGGGAGVTKIDTVGKTIHHVIKEIARVIHCNQYAESDLDARLLSFEEKGYDV